MVQITRMFAFVSTLFLMCFCPFFSSFFLFFLADTISSAYTGFLSWHSAEVLPLISKEMNFIEVCHTACVTTLLTQPHAIPVFLSSFSRSKLKQWQCLHFSVRSHAELLGVRLSGRGPWACVKVSRTSRKYIIFALLAM